MSFQPRQGLLEFHLADDASGEWVALRQRWGVPINSTGFAMVDELVKKLELGDYAQSLAIRTAGVPEPALVPGFIAELDRRDVTRKIARALPPSANEGIRFFQSLLCCEYQSITPALFKPFLDVLGGVLDSAGAAGGANYAPVTWTAEVTARRRLIALEGDELEFAKGFTTISARDPLEGAHIELGSGLADH